MKKIETTGSKIELTRKEQIVFSEIANDDFYEEGVDSVLWVDCFVDHVFTRHGFTKQAIGALITNLKKKKLIGVNVDFDPKTEHDNENTLWLTEAGKERMTPVFAL